MARDRLERGVQKSAGSDADTRRPKRADPLFTHFDDETEICSETGVTAMFAPLGRTNTITAKRTPEKSRPSMREAAERRLSDLPCFRPYLIDPEEVADYNDRFGSTPEES
jgi:hypothetical protein